MAIGSVSRSVLLSVAVSLCASGTAQGRKINLAEVFMQSNIAQCVELSFEGFSVFTKVTPSFLTGISIRIIASPITSHYNPDFIVNAYPRLGTSPSLESFVVFGQVQNILSEPVVEILTGHDVPAAYHNFDEWSGGGAESHSDRSKTTLRYYETEVLGHPGNLYTAVSRGMNGEIPIDIDNIGDVITEIPRQLLTLPSVAQQSVNQLASGVRDLGSAFPDVDGEGFNPVAWGQEMFSENLADLYGMLSSDVVGTISDIASSAGADVGSTITGALDRAQNIDIGEEISNITGGDNTSCDPETDEQCTGPIDELMSMDLSGLPEYVQTEVSGYFQGLTSDDILGFVAPDLQEQLNEVTTLVDTFETFGDSIDIAGGSDAAGGVAARFEQWAGFCPSDTSPMVPYWLSGMNVPGWRFKIPELVYPQTYVPFSNRTTIGNFDPLAALGLDSDSEEETGAVHNYGSVYPRNGFIMQPDSVKAAAVAAFRAAHIVSRPNQPYLYTNAEPQRNDDEYFMFTNSYEDFDSGSGRRSASSTYLHPDVEESGRWQLIHSEGADLDNSCQTFGHPSVNPEVPLVTKENIGSLISNFSNIDLGGFTENKMPLQWSEGKQAIDHQYVFNWWRRYRCAPDPDDNSSWTTHNFNLILPTLTVIE